MNELLREKVNSLPRVPGIYIYKNKKGNVIYVGKAKNLRSRVGSYFQSYIDSMSKTHALVSHIDDLEYIEVLTEFEALLLEAELIKKYRPKYNVIYKDDKSYLYIVIRNEKVLVDKKKILLPVIKTARLNDLKKTDIQFGPYPEGRTAKYIVKTVRKIFPFRDCSTSKFNRYHKLKRPCLYGHIGVCPAPCVKNMDSDLRLYKRNINSIKKMLSGESAVVINNIRNKMLDYSKMTDFENAARYRNLLYKFEYVTGDFKTAREYIENPYLVDDIARQALERLKDHLSSLSSLPRRIECYDISNISGKEAVGSMVVAIDGRIEKSEYRKFKIKTKDTPDDFTMIKEVIYRRLKREKSDGAKATKWGIPDLIVVDGGKGQVTSAYDAMRDIGMLIPLAGIAKKFETLVYKNNDHFEELKLSKDDPGLKLVIALRDEAHRFAQSYHHKLRLKNLSK